MSTVQTQYIRVYAKPCEEKKKKLSGEQKKLSQETETVKKIVKPFGGLVLTFDTETSVGTSQTLRFGFFEIHGLTEEEMSSRYRYGSLQPQDADILRECGIFYEPGNISQQELELLRKYAARVTPEMIARREQVDYKPLLHLNRCEEKISLFTKQQFIKLFYRLQMLHEMLVIGHNLPFDLGVLATTWTNGHGDNRNGFSLKLCDCSHDDCFAHPNLQVKHVGKAMTFMKRRKSKMNTRLEPIHFLDTMTLSASLLGTPHSLDRLSHILLPEKLQKQERPDSILSGWSLTLQDIMYGIQDVHSTWACYRELKKHFIMHDVNTAIWHMYSSASLGKSHLKEFGVRPFLEQHPDFPERVLGYSMLAYYGARCEIGIRLKPVEGLYLDFLSQYPTVNALMKNQDVLLAERAEIVDNTEEIKALVNQDVDQLLDWLHAPENWQDLRCFVQVLPNKDRLPLRSDYGREEKNVGLPYVTSSTPTWYTLADVLASKLLTKKTPTIVEALKLVPSTEKYTTEIRELFGYTIDLEKQDFFQTLIELRQQIKKQPGALAENQQLALKLISNATSYGALVEINQGETTQEATDATFYDVAGNSKNAKVHRVEKVGKFFAGPIGSLIPASGRLLLAIVQSLANQRGILHAMMDTDGVFLAKPETMTRDDFREKVLEVARWFSAISPYENLKDILEVEKYNCRWNDETGAIEEKVLEPLYLIGISAKRYVVYNKLPDGTYRIRKFSTHGLGGIHTPYGNERSPFLAIPTPCQNVHALGGARWVYDMWYQFIEATETGKNYTVSDALNVPAYHQATLSTWKLYNQFQSIPNVRPFGFFSVLPSRVDSFKDIKRTMDKELELFVPERLEYIQSIRKPFYAPYASNPEELQNIKRMDDNSLVPDWYSPITVKEVVKDYFTSKEWKAVNSNDTGIMYPHDVKIGYIVYVGKEINAISLEQAEETGTLMGEMIENVVIYGKEATQNWQEVLCPYHIADLSLLTGLTGRAINKIKAGKGIPTNETKQRLEEARKRLDKVEKQALQWRGLSNQELAAKLNVSLEEVKQMKYAKHPFTNEQREILLSYEL